jgi:hypothetical protein
MTPRNTSRSRRRGGQTMLEFTLVGIPIIFVLISIFEISRGMWIYETMAYSVKQGVRYATSHGFNCTKNGNTCTVKMGPAAADCNALNALETVATVIRCAAAGLDPATTNITFYTFIDPAGKVKQGGPCTLETSGAGACLPTVFPPDPQNRVTTYKVEVDMRTTFRSALSFFWPSAGTVHFGTFTLGANSADSIQF